LRTAGIDGQASVLLLGYGLRGCERLRPSATSTEMVYEMTTS
jgi:hypothetical protein